jgi:hypothetical protein
LTQKFKLENVFKMYFINLESVLNFVKLKGETFSDKVYINIAEFLYITFRIIYRILSTFINIKSLPPGTFLFHDVIAKNSYGNFYCRKNEEDLSIISDGHEPKTLFLFKKISQKE